MPVNGHVLQGLGQDFRYEHFIPTADGLIDRRPETDFQPQVKPEIPAGQAPGMVAPCLIGGARAEFRRQGAAQGLVNRVANTRRAVIVVIVVEVIAPVGPHFPEQVSGEPGYLLAGEIEPLRPDLPVFGNISRELVAHWLRCGEIQHAALQKAHEEILLCKIEESEIESMVQAQAGVSKGSGRPISR